IVIDEDVGRSGTGRHERPGFGQLLAAVCAGRVGAVFAWEASRLARHNRDWHHLIDLCALTATLLIDDDGIYDPRQLNDRLVLGVKGSMAGYELGLMRQRARPAFEAKIHRAVVQGAPRTLPTRPMTSPSGCCAWLTPSAAPTSWATRTFASGTETRARHTPMGSARPRRTTNMPAACCSGA